MRRLPRRLLWTLLVGAVLVLAAGALFLLPRVDAMRCLLAFQRPVPADDAVPSGCRRVRDPGRLGVTDAWVARPAGGGTAPLLVLVPGIAEKGLSDGRIVRAVDAFRRGGFVVVAPRVEGLVRPGAGDPDPDSVARLLRALEDGALPDSDASRIGVVGISVGGAYALRVAARHRASGGRGLRAILLLGAPADLDRLAVTWFATPPLGKDEPDTAEDHRRHAAELARNVLWRVAAPHVVPDADDAARLERWLAARWVPGAAPEGLRTDAARAFVAMVGQGVDTWSRTAPGILRASDAWTVWLSPSRWPQELASLAGVPVFLLHGEGDPLVPVTEMALLERLLAPSTTVETLTSHMVGHVDVEEAGTVERLAHVSFVQAFFDAVKE